MRQALISDIHGNLEALTAVLADIREQRVDRIVCLGDVVGYGPNPCECFGLSDAQMCIYDFGQPRPSSSV